MELRRLRLDIGSGELVHAVYARDLQSGPDRLYLKLGDVCLSGTPAAMVDMLSRALGECYVAWGAGSETGHDDTPGGPGATAHNIPLPPQSVPSWSALRCQGSPQATAQPLVLDRGSGADLDNPRSLGGGDKTRRLPHEQGRW
jgi:hypothetical protein